MTAPRADAGPADGLSPRAGDGGACARKNERKGTRTLSYKTRETKRWMRRAQRISRGPRPASDPAGPSRSAPSAHRDRPVIDQAVARCLAVPEREALQAVAYDEALLFMQTLFGNGDSRCFINLRMIRPGMRAPQEFIPVAELERAATTAIAANKGFDVYVGVLPRPSRSGKGTAVRSGRAVWADCDSQESVERLASFPIPPSIVVASGSPATAMPTGCSTRSAARQRSWRPTGGSQRPSERTAACGIGPASCGCPGRGTTSERHRRP